MWFPLCTIGMKITTFLWGRREISVAAAISKGSACEIQEVDLSLKKVLEQIPQLGRERSRTEKWVPESSGPRAYPAMHTYRLTIHNFLPAPSCLQVLALVQTCLTFSLLWHGGQRRYFHPYVPEAMDAESQSDLPIVTRYSQA